MTIFSRLQTLTLCGALVYGAPPALADDAPEPVSLQFEAPAGCASRQEFVSLVEAYTRKVQWVTPDRAKRHFSVRVTARKDDAVGTLTIDEEGERTVTARSCGEIVDALALATALAIDPADATTAPEPEPEPEPKRSPQPKPEAKPPASLPQREAELAAGSIGASGHLLFAVAPEIVAGASLDISLRGQLASAFDASLQVSVGYLDSGWLEPASTVRLRWLPWLRARGCAPHIGLTGPLGLAPCIGGQYARLQSEAGSRIVEPYASATRDWFAIDASAELELRFGTLGLYLLGGGVLPLMRLQYLVGGPTSPDTEVSTLSVKPSVFAGLGARLRVFGGAD